MNGGEPAQGLIDEVGIFNGVLSADDVSAIMTGGLAQEATAVELAEKLAVTWGGLKK